MSNETLKVLLQKLHETLETETVAAEKLSELKQLDAEIQKLISTDNSDSETQGLLTQAKQVEAKFEMEHPGTATLFGQLINTLSGMGV